MKCLKLLLAASLVALPLAQASADTCTEKQQAYDLIYTLKIKIAEGDYKSRWHPSKDEMGLDAKAEGARIKIVEDKLGDAATKLEDIISKVAELTGAPKPKLDEQSGYYITVAASDALYCVGDLMGM